MSLEKASYEKASHALLYIAKIGQCHQCLESGLDVMEKICLEGVRSPYLEIMNFRACLVDHSNLDN